MTARLVLLGVFLLGGLAAGCSGDAEEGPKTCEDDSWWVSKRPPAVACTASPENGVDPKLGVSFAPGHMLCVDLQIAEDDYAALQVDTAFGPNLCAFDAMEAMGKVSCGEPWPKEYSWYPATVMVDGVTLDEVGVRRKGFIGSLFSFVPAFKIKTDKFVDGQFLGDTERVTLNNNAGDPTHVGACVIYEIFNAAGHPAPRCNLANVMVNGEPLGPYTHIEAIKVRFLERAFGDATGSLYEGTGADFVLAVLPRFEVKTDDTDAALGPLKDLAEALLSPDDELVEALDPILNIERFATYWALEVLVNHQDGYNSSRNNFYVYFDPQDSDRAVFIPWGMDKTPSAASSSSLGSFVSAEVSRRLSRIPTVNQQMRDELQRIVDEVWNEGALLSGIDMYAALVNTAQVNDADYDASVEAVRNWVRGRPGVIAGMLASGLPAGAAEAGACGFSKGGKDDGDDDKGCDTEGETFDYMGMTWVCENGEWVEEGDGK